MVIVCTGSRVIALRAALSTQAVLGSIRRTLLSLPSSSNTQPEYRSHQHLTLAKGRIDA